MSLSRYITNVGLYLGSTLGFRTQSHTNNETTTLVAVRRVVTQDEGEHVQMEVRVTRHHAKRDVTSYGYIHLSPEQAAQMAKALTEIEPRASGDHFPHEAMRVHADLMAQHYGLTPAQVRSPV